MVRSESVKNGSPNKVLPHCYSVWTALQPMFYGLRLLPTTRVSRVDSHVELVGVSFEERGGVTSSLVGEKSGVTPHGGSLAVS